MSIGHKSRNRDGDRANILAEVVNPKCALAASPSGTVLLSLRWIAPAPMSRRCFQSVLVRVLRMNEFYFGGCFKVVEEMRNDDTREGFR